MTGNSKKFLQEEVAESKEDKKEENLQQSLESPRMRNREDNI